MCGQRPRRPGLTVVGVLVILVILAVVAGIIVSAIPAWREKANRLQCANNLKQIGEAVYLFQDDRDHPCLPPSRIAEKYATWAAILLPYLPKGKDPPPWDLHKSYYDQPAGTREFQVKQYYCPSRRSPPWNSTAGD